jgi:hypothetical protein
MRAQPSTQIQRSLGPVFDAPAGRFQTCVQVAQMLDGMKLKPEFFKDGLRKKSAGRFLLTFCEKK